MNQFGKDLTVEILKKQGKPVTLQNYLELEYPDRDFKKNPATAEEIVMMPEYLWRKEEK